MKKTRDGGPSYPAVTPQFSFKRRRVLHGLVAAGTLALAPHEARAQGSRTLSVGARIEASIQASVALLTLPRQALVIGNSRYKESPLKNPANDANAMGESLKRIGFNVVQLLDAGRDQMHNAIQAFGESVAKRNSIGLFYFAGHGVQLAWRNYLIPVDAVIDNPDDVRERAAELNTLLQGLTRAKNAMNVIILDACRDNPFGTRVPVVQKGLSQFDAPPGSLLAYATSPGNVASDGDGTNGLYTENLLRELQVPDAKIEDVFKRVRLNVRRRSNGQQIPWESTSLEEDFYFQPPKELRRIIEAEEERQLKIAEAEKERLRRTIEAEKEKLRKAIEAEEEKKFEEELALWESIKESKEPKPLEDYLRRHPSGRYSELAQLQLDRILARLGEQKIEIASSVGNPYTAGTARADTNFKVGDRYIYRVSDMFTGVEERQMKQVVTEITDSEVIFNNGVVVTDLLGNVVKSGKDTRFSGNQFFLSEYSVGKRWTTRFVITFPEGPRISTENDFKVVKRESVTVPAGTFDCYKVEGHGWRSSPKVPGLQVSARYTYWIAPGRVRRFIKSEELRESIGGRGGRNIGLSERRELTAYHQS